MTQFKLYHVRAHNVGQTLADMLRNVYAGKSWGEIKQMVRGRKVEINGNLCIDETRRLKPGEIVRVHGESLAKPPDEQHINIRHQDEHLLVVEKPPGITTLRHREEQHWDDKRKNRQPTLEELLQKVISLHGVSRMPGRGAGHPLQQSRKQLNRKIVRGQAKLKVRAVHRLDRETSGLMIFALSPVAEQALVKMFSSHTVERAYLAVVHGEVSSPGRIESMLTRDRGDGLRGSLPAGKTTDDAKAAVTHYKPIRRIGPLYTLIECRLETGRTHQIRIHLAEAGHMLCGEEMYTRRQPGAEIVQDVTQAPRHALHAYKLSFAHPVTGERLTFEQKMPVDLAKWMKKLEPVETDE